MTEKVYYFAVILRVSRGNRNDVTRVATCKSLADAWSCDLYTRRESNENYVRRGHDGYGIWDKPQSRSG